MFSRDFFPFSLFSIIPLIVTFGFIAFFIFFIFIAVKGIKQWNYNNNQPVLTVWAKVVAKRTNVSSGGTHNNYGNVNVNVNHTSSSTSYYVTFQVESGDRMELHVRGDEYGMLIEGDAGKLTFQGTRYLGFRRNIE